MDLRNCPSMVHTKTDTHTHTPRKRWSPFALNICDLLGVPPDGLLDFSFSFSSPYVPHYPTSVRGTFKIRQGTSQQEMNDMHLCVSVCECERVRNSRRGGKGTSRICDSMLHACVCSQQHVLPIGHGP